MRHIHLSDRQNNIIDIVKVNQPITSEEIASKLNLTRATIRPDLSILTMSGILEARPKVGYFIPKKQYTSYVSDKISSVLVKEIMSFPVVIDEQNSVYDAIVTMFTEDVGSIFITNKGYLSGVVSRKDLLKATLGSIDVNNTPISVLMTRISKLITINKGESALAAATRLVNHEIDSLPVVEPDNEGIKIIGRVTKTTITRLFVELGTNL